MKTLYESILSKTKVGIVHIDPKQVELFTSCTLNKFLNMQTMYKDAAKIKGEPVYTHADAFRTILCDYNYPRKEWEEMIKMDPPEINDAADKIFKKAFEKYLNNPKGWHFFFTPSPHWKDTFDVGIMESKTWNTYTAVQIKL